MQHSSVEQAASVAVVAPVVEIVAVTGMIAAGPAAFRSSVAGNPAGC